MTTPAEAPKNTSAKKAGVPKTIWDLVFTFVIPILILSPNILGSGVSIAMANASAEVQHAATFVTTSNTEEGFALAMERFVLDARAVK